MRRYGRGLPRKEFLVKWTGWDRPTWEPASSLNDAAALNEWEQQKTSADSQEGGNVRGWAQAIECLRLGALGIVIVVF